MLKPSHSSEEVQFELLISSFLEHGYSVHDNFFSREQIKGLRRLVMNYDKLCLLKKAQVGNTNIQSNDLIRGDRIKWIEEDSNNNFEKVYLNKIERFKSYLNQTCFTGLNSKEAHYVIYPIGSFYKLHRDQFRNDDSREISLVLYINEGWKESDEGALSFNDRNNNKVNVLPTEGRLVMFKSDVLLHEVLPSTTRDRISIACWLKK